MMSSISRLFGKNADQEGQYDYLEQVIQINVQEIRPNQYQPRTIFDDSKIEELAETIRTHGVIQPIVVRKLEDEDGYELIAGERRWRAVVSLGWDTIPAIVKNMTDTETASVALIENLQREELTVIEEAIAYDQLLNSHGLTQEALAQRLGKSQSTIANKLRLLKLPKVVQQSLLNKEITERHARALLKLKDESEQEKLLQTIIEKKLNVKQTDEHVEKTLYPEEKETVRRKPQLRGISRDIRIALNTIRQSVNMVQESGMNVQAEEKDSDEYYEITIKLPKK